jgi:hypothetical protein
VFVYFYCEHEWTSIYVDCDTGETGQAERAEGSSPESSQGQCHSRSAEIVGFGSVQAGSTMIASRLHNCDAHARKKHLRACPV